MNRTPRRLLALIPVAVLSLSLTLLLSGGDAVRAMLQASPISTPTRPAPTVPVPTVPAPGVVAPPTVEVFPTLEPPTSVPLPPAVQATPTVQGFLPAPTIVNPNDLKNLPLAQPPVSGGGGDETAALPPTPVPTNSSARAIVSLINSLWLLCGGALVIGGAVAIFLIWRRGQQT